jgi:hypothetical protein
VSARTMSISRGVENEKSDMVTYGRVACPLVGCDWQWDVVVGCRCM